MNILLYFTNLYIIIHMFLLYYLDIGQKIEIKVINLVLLIPELCLFMRFKLYPENLVNAHAQIKKNIAYQQLLY